MEEGLRTKNAELVSTGCAMAAASLQAGWDGDLPGCGIHVTGEDLQLIDCLIRQHATSGQGSIFVSGSVDMFGCRIEDCIASSGTGLTVTPSGSARIENSLFVGNVAEVQAAAIQVARRRLPVWEARKALVQAVRDNETLVLTGETGCGKTSLEHMLINSICT
jgi:ABC-type glutathione transport system ATPase component